MSIIESITDIDKECVALCDAINLYAPAIRTVESCCGHGEKEYSIWMHVEPEGLPKLPELLYWFDDCHSGRIGWRCEVYTDCGMSPVVFNIEGPTGEQAYDDAEHIAGLISEGFGVERNDPPTEGAER